MLQSMRTIRFVVGVAFLCGVLVAAASGQGRRPSRSTTKFELSLSRRTTFITKPLREDGTPDYHTFLNAKLRGGFKPNDNAAVYLLTAVGPELFDERVRDWALELLNMKALPVEGKYFVPLADYVKDLPPDKRPEGGAFPEAQVRSQLEKALVSPWAAKEYPTLAGWIEANKGPLEMIRLAAKRSDLYLPILSTQKPRTVRGALSAKFEDVLTDPLSALLARALLQLEAGDFAGTEADLMAAFRLARLFAKEPTEDGWSFGNALDSIAITTARSIITRGKLTARQAKAMVVDLSALESIPAISDAYGLGERLTALEQAMQGVRAKSDVQFAEDIGMALDTVDWSRYKVDWNEVLKRINARFDRELRATEFRTLAEREKAFALLGRDYREIIERCRSKWRKSAEVAKVLNPPEEPEPEEEPVDPDRPPRRPSRRPTRRPAARRPEPEEIEKEFTQAVGDLMLARTAFSFARPSGFCDDSEMALEVVRVAAALTAYRADKGSYPKSLDSLAPSYLRDIPEDLFAAKPLKYVPNSNGYLLYSVGANKKDDGGKWDRDNKKKKKNDDIAVRATN